LLRITGVERLLTVSSWTALHSSRFAVA